jgi:acyl-CoA thioesterase-2
MNEVPRTAASPLTPAQLVERLVRLLDVEEIDTDLYRGPRLPEGRGRVFGGQVIGQALMAAMRSTGEGRAAHSLHAYFLRAGDDALPIVYRVERDFDGKSFANRRVIALQRGQPILNMAASFQTPEEGLTHQASMPDVPPPESLVSEAELLRQEREAKGGPEPIWFSRPQPIEIRPVEARPMFSPEKREPRFASWFKVVGPVGEDADLNRAILAYASDMRLLATSMLPHGVSWATPGMQTASLDHALWMHQEARTDDWLLFATDSPWSGHARGFNRGQIFSRDGRLVASIAQEGLIRRRPV